MSHPLLCWDIYLDAKQRRLELATDLNAIHNMILQFNWNVIDNFIEHALLWQGSTIVITNLNAEIIFASENIFKMTGYNAQEIIGKKPTIFQGAATETNQKELIKASISNQQPFEAVLTNYKKDGTHYKCHIQGFPMFNKTGKLINFVAIEKAA
ncbi:MAG: PAS domain-containing protein [Chitinophagaceae bacterium]